MSFTTDVQRAIECVEDEQSWTTEKRQAFQRFDASVAELETGSTRGWTGLAGGPTTVTSGESSGSSVAAVLDAFEDHLEGYCGDAVDTPDSVHESVAVAFSSDLAVSLCGANSNGTLTPQLKQVVRSQTRDRLQELQVMDNALSREASSLGAVADVVDTVCGWFLEHNSTPLSTLDFETLRARHDALEAHRERLDDAATERQRTIHASTGGGGAVGIEQRVLVAYLYTGFSVDYPALSTITRLDSLCGDAQRTVRRHLCTRV